MKNLSNFLLLLLTAALILSCATTTRQPLHDELASHIDSTVRPGDDFFLFANGKWFKEHPIPPTEQSNGLWQLIRDTVNAQVLNICTTSAAITGEPAGSNKQKIGDFYFSGMDTLSVNRKGLTELADWFARIDAIEGLPALTEEVARIHTMAAAPFFSLYVTQDDRISSKYALYINQGGLSLPDRSYYFDNDPQAKMVREKFTEYLKNAFMLMGYPEKKAMEASARVMKFETDLARNSRKLEDTRDPLTNYNKFPVAKLKEMVSLDWEKLFAITGLGNVDTVISGQPEFLTGLNSLLQKMPPEYWKDYLKIQLFTGLAPYLDDRSYNEMFSFYFSTLRGIPEPKPRWKRVVNAVDNFLGPVIGQVYVKEYLPEGTKEKLMEIGNAIREVYAGRIRELDWMTPPTKEKALVKLDKMIMKVGYPDNWKDMSRLQVNRESYLQNAMRANEWWFTYNTGKFGKPVDRTEWSMDPQTYNAYYNPSNNEICVPGCNIIVPGYERVMADDAILYAIIGGSTFGHEMTHGFDDQGCKYDENGNLNNWWTPEDSARFFARTAMIVNQFNQYQVADSLYINGSQTQGENIADLAGIILGYQAFQKRPQFLNKEIIGGLDPSQRYFLAYGMAWMINDRPEAIANQVRMDVHSPAKFRVNGPLADVDAFYTTFGVKEGDRMWLPDSLRVKIW